MNTLSIPIVAMASISLYVGSYHLLIYFRRRRNRENLTFSFLCFAYVFYATFCVGLYNATSVIEGAQWQRSQFIALAIFVTAFLWFVSDYTRQKPGTPIYLLSIFYLLAIIVQLVDRSYLTFLVDQPAVKHITLPYVQPITYYETALGPFSIVQALMGMITSTYILIMGIRYFRRGYKREAKPLILAIALMYATGFHDILVSNGVYDFIYLIEYAYLAIILAMANSLSNTVVETAIAKEELRKSEERFRSLVETTSDWVWEVNADGVYTYASPKVRDLLGYEPEEIIGRTPFDLMPAEEAERVSAIFQNTLLQKKSLERVENIARCKDGQLKVLETSGVPFFDEQGKLLGYRGIDRDVTERKRTQEEIEREKQRFQMILQTVRVPTLISRLSDGKVLYANQAIAQASRVNLDKLIDFKTPGFYANPDHRKTVLGSLREHGYIDDFEVQFRRTDGSEYWALLSSRIFEYEGESCVLSTYVDITERKQAEEALRDSEQKFRLFVEQSSDALVFTDEYGIIIEWNQAQEHLTGVPRQECIGRPLWDVQIDLSSMARHIPGQRKELEQRILRALETGQADFLNKLMEFVLFRRDGTKVIVQQMTFAIKTNQGYRLGSIIRDITKLKQVEEELRASEERYRRLVEVSPIPMWTNTDGMITYVNPAALRVLGATHPDQVLGRLATDFIHPDYHALVQERVSQMVEVEKSAPLVEEKYIRLDGNLIDVEVIATPFSTSGGTVIQVLFQDITRRKQNEAERESLIANLEAKNAELERFTYTVSHDLKAPLITIRGFLGFIEQDVQSGNMNRVKGDIQRISAATDKMQRLLNELLELSRIGRLTNPPENIAFGDMTQEVVKLLEGRLRERNIEVKIQDDLPVVCGDSQRLSEVVQNLLDNAVKFMGGQARPVIEIGTRGEENGMPILYVRDNGIGIAPEHHDRIFGLFNKLDPRAEGTGVGLAIVKRIVEVHGGRVWVESEPGKGTTFYFTFGRGTQGSEVATITSNKA